MEGSGMKPQCPFRPQIHTNFESSKEVVDSLLTKTEENGVCSDKVCNGSSMNIRRMALEPRSSAEVLTQARQFLEEYYKDIKGLDGTEHKERLKEVTSSITRTGTYQQTQHELQFGAKLAWRNAPRCIGRISWNKLHLIDGRHVKTAKEIFELMLEHLDYATNGGNIRSTITVFPPRKPGQRDFRVWNQQLLGYAGYEQPDGSVIGDPVAKEFTKICQKLGWKGKGGQFDYLPWVVSTPTGEPEWFEIPEEKILRVPIKHPKYEWFEELQLEWFAVPAVSSMMFDCGGIQYTAAPFNGWYMATEIGTRDLCDAQRYNMLPIFGEKLGLDMKADSSLWKDKATLEINIAVLHSFKEKGITIVDHHTAAKTFMQFHSNEYRQRGGCPADWIWIVPPISGSLTPVFHQEMSLYYLKPAYEYQIPGWIAQEKQNKMLSGENTNTGRSLLKTFKKAAIAVKFASCLYSAALARRTRILILYGSETGKAQAYANTLHSSFSRNFNPQVMSMADYDVKNLSSETMVVILASTTGSGEPPQNAKNFTESLYVLRGNSNKDRDEYSVPFSEDYNEFKVKGNASPANSVIGVDEKKLLNKKNKGFFSRLVSKLRRERRHESSRYLARHDLDDLYLSSTSLYKSSASLNRSTNNIFRSTTDPASDVAFAVFALGSTDYKYYCAYGKYIDNMMSTLGGERIMDLTHGNEVENQLEAFNTWTSELHQVCCNRFGVQTDSQTISIPRPITEAKQVRIEDRITPVPLVKGLSDLHGKTVETCTVITNKSLYRNKDNKWYHKVVISTGDKEPMDYVPGDHVGVFPCNNQAMVHGILTKLTNYSDPDTTVQILVQKHEEGSWMPHPTLPVASIRTLLESYLDITSTPSRELLKLMAQAASNNAHVSRLNQLALDEDDYRLWKKVNSSNLFEVLNEFPSIRMDAGLLLCRLPLLQPRLYSISSSPEIDNGQLTLTIASFNYKTKGGKGVLHKGVCTSYLQSLKPGDRIELYHKSAPEFHLPEDEDVPLILIGAGSGIAPLRGFWHHHHHKYNIKEHNGPRRNITLYYGCQTKETDLYAKEKELMVKFKVLKANHLALSREQRIPKAYVQDLLLVNGKEIYKQVALKGGHVYVCGSESMAEGITHSLLSILIDQGRKTEEQAKKTLQRMREQGRYHEDIFGNGSR